MLMLRNDVNFILFVVLASVNQLDNKTVKEGASVSLNCIVIGFPVPLVAWSKVGSTMVIEDRFFLTSQVSLKRIKGSTSALQTTLVEVISRLQTLTCNVRS